jgi:hypothetical protein
MLEAPNRGESNTRITGEAYTEGKAPSFGTAFGYRSLSANYRLPAGTLGILNSL